MSMRFVFFITLLSTLGFGLDTQTQEGKVLSANNDIIITDIGGIKNHSGIVVKDIDSEHSTIIAKVIALDSNASASTLAVLPYDELIQESLPTAIIKPKVGNRVVMNHMYDRGVIIAPNYPTYQNVKNRYSDITWYHPDLLSVELAKQSNPAPKKEDFYNFCKEYTLGVLFFALKDRGVFVDCLSFKVIEEVDGLTQEETQMNLPFYSRISSDIESSFFNPFATKSIQNFNSYYTNLLR